MQEPISIHSVFRLRCAPSADDCSVICTVREVVVERDNSNGLRDGGGIVFVEMKVSH